MAKRRLLTRKKQRWAQNRDVTLRGSPLRFSITTEQRYAASLDRITLKMIEITKRNILQLFRSDDAKRFYAMDASLSSQARILLNAIERDFQKQFKNQGQRYAKTMVNNVDQNSKSSLHSSLEKLSGGLSIKTDILTGDLKDVLTATVAENAGLIKTIPETFLGNVRGLVMRSITQPNTGGIAELINNLDGLLDKEAKNIRNKAKNLALDQTRKLYNNLNAERMQAVGIQKFEWIHSGGSQKPRQLHRDVLNGQIFSLDDLPIIDERTGERGIPGQAINCKCTMKPVIEFANGLALAA